MNVVMGIRTETVVGGALLVGFCWRVWRGETRRGKGLKNKEKINEVSGKKGGERRKEGQMNQLEAGRKKDKWWLGRNK
jgi:hypothetical protein